MELFELQFLMTLMVTAVSSVHANLPTFYLDEWCAITLDLRVQGLEGGRMMLRPPERGLRYPYCFVFFKAPPGKRLSFKFRTFDIQSPYDCDKDYLQLFDDRSMRLELTGHLCNSGQTPSGVYTTTAEDGTIKLSKKNYLADQIEIIFTAFHLSPCRGEEFRCDNSHCIHEDLYCNDFDNCGDESDICLLNTSAIAAIIIAAIIIIIIIAVVVAIVLYRRQQHRRLEKLRMRHEIVMQDGKGPPIVLHEEHIHYVDVWDKKSSLSESTPSTISSRLSKEKVTHQTSTASDNVTSGDTLTKQPYTTTTFRSEKHGNHSKEPTKIHFRPLKSSTLKKSSSENGVHEIYAVPKKKKQKKSLFGLKRKSSSVRYLNDLETHQENGFSVKVYPPVSASPPQMFERNPSFREGMKGEKESQLPIHTLDPSTLPGAHHHLQSPDVYDHVMSFRSYPSPEPSRKERVVYLYPKHPGYHRLYHHGHEEALQSERASLHSSRSSLVKL